MNNKHIFISTVEEDKLTEGEIEAGIGKPGWYFWDETWCNAHGPFGTIGECEQLYNNYMESL